MYILIPILRSDVIPDSCDLSLQQPILLKIRNISNYISFPLQIAYKVIEAGISEGILQVLGLSIDTIQ